MENRTKVMLVGGAGALAIAGILASRANAAAAKQQTASEGAAKRVVEPKTVQSVLRDLGYLVPADGKFGPRTYQAWQQAAKKRKLPPLIEPVPGAPREEKAAVIEATAKALAKAAIEARKKRIVKESKKIIDGKRDGYSNPAPVVDAAARAEAARAAAEAAARIAAADKAKQAAADAAQRKAADAAAAKAAADAAARAGAADAAAKKAAADAAAKAAADAAAKKAAADAAAKKAAADAAPSVVIGPAVITKPADATTIDVGGAQDTLRALGANITRDGKFGPRTLAAWQAAARNRGLNPAFHKVDATHAGVSDTTAKALAIAAAQKIAEGKPAIEQPGTKLLAVIDAQGELRRLGHTVVEDGIYGAKTAAAWGAEAKTRGVDGTFSRVDGKTARVAAAAFNAIICAPTPQPQPPAPPPVQTRAPAGYDQEKARKMAPQVTANLRKGRANYARDLLRSYQTAAGIVPPNGSYGPQTEASLRYFGQDPPAHYFTAEKSLTTYTPPG